MPEGDTIHRTAAALRTAVIGKPLTAFEAPRLNGLRPTLGAVIERVESHGKHLEIGFDDGVVLHTHMRMTGSWHLYRSGELWRKSSRQARVIIEVPGWQAVCFSAPVVRTYRAKEFLPNPRLAQLGPDLVRPDADLDEAVARIDRFSEPTTTVAEVLLDQRIACGVGNVYKSEVLWVGELHPFTPIGALLPEQRHALLATAAGLLRSNVDRPNRITVPGVPGGQAVYGRHKKPCFRCGTPVEVAKHGEQARVTYWCPGCQLFLPLLDPSALAPEALDLDDDDWADGWDDEDRDDRFSDDRYETTDEPAPEPYRPQPREVDVDALDLPRSSGRPSRGLIDPLLDRDDERVGSWRMRVGDLEILPVHDGVGRFPVSEAFETMPAEAWEPHRRFLTADGELELALGGFLLRTGDRVVVIDCGVGAITSGPFQGGAFLTSLAAHGVEPADVTDVLFTHLHFDHVGWATKQGAVVFPNATYRCDERDWAHFVGPDPGATRKLSPLTDRMDLWSRSGPLLPGLDVLLAPGHTPGSTMMVVSSQGERAMLLGDVVHCPVELLDDEWAGMADVDPELAHRTRLALVRELEGTDVPVAAAHFPDLQFGRLLFGEGRRSWVVE